MPGTALDRTGIALCGAIAMLVCGVVPLDALPAAVHVPTMLLLFGTMILNAQFQLTGFYPWLADRLRRQTDRPRRFLATTMAASAAGSALLINDVVCLALTPILAVALQRSPLNPVPFLLGIALASNIGSAATLIGNPQNMLIGQYGGLGFWAFTAWAMPPVVASLAIAFGVLCWMYRGRLRGMSLAAESPVVPPVDRGGLWKACLATVALVVLFSTPVPRELSAMGVAGFVLLARRHPTNAYLERVDWSLLVLFFGLFVVVHGIEVHGVPAAVMGELSAAGVDVGNPWLLTGVAAALSNLVSNVPATMLLVRLIDPADTLSWCVLAVASTFAGNLITIGSIANLIVLEQARRAGIVVTFREHAAVGVVVTLASLAVLSVWLVVVR